MIKWVCKNFNELSALELYAIMRLRSEVFVVEQNCVYLDADGKDEYCYHLAGYVGNELVAVARLLPAKVSYPEVSIGRVATSPFYRKMNAGKELMLKAIEECNALFGSQPIKIGAQLYLKKFYESFGFLQCGGEYDEDGIMHIPMLAKI